MAQEFDLDRDAVVEEVSVAPPPPPEAPAAAEEEDEETRRCREAKEWKEKGNAHYVLKSFEKALECYASALETCPGSSEPPAPPPDLADAEQGAESQAEVIENGAAEAPPTVEETAAAVGALSIAKQDGEAQVEGEAPPPADDRDPVAVAAAAAEAATNEKYAEQRAVLHCNAAACLQQLNRDEEAAGECSIALALSPRYVKCYMRRGQALEKLERWGEASKDMDAVLAMEPNSKLAKDRKARCDKLEAERLEKLKVLDVVLLFSRFFNSVLLIFSL
jgi:tetratricopeptide (TPR) repeat protein